MLSRLMHSFLGYIRPRLEIIFLRHFRSNAPLSFNSGVAVESQGTSPDPVNLISLPTHLQGSPVPSVLQLCALSLGVGLFSSTESGMWWVLSGYKVI